jgi:hypothetical protein
MKSRFAMMAMIVVGLLMSGTGAGLAVSGSDATGNAALSQYPQNTTPPTPSQPSAGGTLPTTTTGGSSCDENGDGVVSPSEAAKEGCGAVKGETEESAPAASAPAQREQAAQPTRQVAAGGGDELPFTGFAAIPILVIGMGLLAGGLVLRRRTSA